MSVRGYAVVVVSRLGNMRVKIEGEVIFVADTGSAERNRYLALVASMRHDYPP